MEKKELIDQIVKLEWKMFQDVNNRNGRASCQDDRITFDIMRRSQANTRNEDILGSYLLDLINAEAEDRNLLMEKYAYMMEYTHPTEFEDIKSALPYPDAETCAYIKEIMDIYLEWHRETTKKYPSVSRGGRPETNVSDDSGFTSFETYLRCELQTYSTLTLKLFLLYVRDCKEKGINLGEQELDFMMRSYGFASLEDAERRQRVIPN